MASTSYAAQVPAKQPVELPTPATVPALVLTASRLHSQKRRHKHQHRNSTDGEKHKRRRKKKHLEDHPRIKITVSNCIFKNFKQIIGNNDYVNLFVSLNYMLPFLCYLKSIFKRSIYLCRVSQITSLLILLFI